MAIAVKPKPRLEALRMEGPFTVIVIRVKKHLHPAGVLAMWPALINMINCSKTGIVVSVKILPSDHNSSNHLIRHFIQFCLKRASRLWI